LALALFSVCAYASARAQISQITNALTPSAATAHTQQDPLGRDTPSGTVFGFLQAAQSGNYVSAAQYLQMTTAKRQSQGEEVATKLKVVMDRAFNGNVRLISTLPQGAPQEGIALDKQDIGLLSAGDVETDLILVRATDPGGARIWLISADTIAKVDELYDQLEVHQVETRLPAWLVKYQLAGMGVWQWLAVLIALPLAMGVGWLLTRLISVPRYAWLRYRKQPHTALWSAISTPLWMVISTAVHDRFVISLRLPLLPRHYYQIAITIVFVIGLSWLLWRTLKQLAYRIRQHAIYAGRTGTGSLLLLGERIVKAVIFVVAILGILSALGFNMSTALAGLGIGGIAIAFAAQKTLENLFGGISVLGDEVIRVGDTCRFGDRVGTVEDISLRSSRIRTPERTQLSIPNGALAAMNIDNLSRRDKILFNPKLGLRSETTPDQLRFVLAELRRLLYEHPKVETDGARVRFTSIDTSSLSLDFFAYVLTTDMAEFLAIQEDLLLHILEIVDRAGSGFAFPSQTLYMSKDSGVDAEKASAAVQTVQKWKESGDLPFPDFAAGKISEISNSMPYPQTESAVRKPKQP